MFCEQEFYVLLYVSNSHSGVSQKVLFKAEDSFSDDIYLYPLDSDIPTVTNRLNQIDKDHLADIALASKKKTKKERILLGKTDRENDREAFLARLDIHYKWRLEKLYNEFW